MLTPGYHSGRATVESCANHGACFSPVKIMQILRLIIFTQKNGFI
jgi:hypothetical protein